MSVPNPYRPFNYSSCSHTKLSNTTHSVKERREKIVNLEINSFVHSPNAYCLLVNINRSILQRIKTVPVRILVLFYTVNFTTYSSKVDYTYACTKTRHNTLKTKFEGKKGFRL